MPSTFSSNLRVELMADGEQSTVWGQKTNTNLELLEAAISEMATIATTGGSTTLTALDGADDESRKACLKITGVLVSNATIVIPAVTKAYWVWNATSGAYTVTIKTAAGTGQTITANQLRQVFCDGTDVYNLVANSVSGGTVGGTASALTYDLSSNTFTGTLAQFNTACSDADFAASASPAFTGTPTAPTAAPGTNTTQIATTAFVTAAASSTSSGTYTPTLTHVLNITGSLAIACQWMRVGNVVTVSGALEIEPTTASTISEIDISLPVASAVTIGSQIAGTGAAILASPAFGGSISANYINDRARYDFITSTDVSPRQHSFIFTYRVI